MRTGGAKDIMAGMILDGCVGHLVLLQCISSNCRIINMHYIVYMVQYLQGSVVSHCWCFKVSSLYDYIKNTEK